MSIDPKTLRKAQLIMLDMLVEFHEICEKHNLKYWLDSGTLLGAVRHQGFIPWDDDIDLSMPLEDYIKFQEIAKKGLSEHVFVQNKQIERSFPFDYTKLRSNKASIVEFHETGKEVSYHQGVFVDIFPMLTVPNSKFHYWYYKIALKLIRFFSEKNLHVQTSIPSQPLRRFFTWTLKRMHKTSKDNDTNIIYSGEMPDVAAWFDKKEIFPLKTMKFEGLEFYVPKDPDHYLENIYSFNYMELPPEEKRTIHAHKVIIH